MGRYLLSIGSNCHCAAEMMARAENWLRNHFDNVESSGIYRTRAHNGRSADYLNMVARGTSQLSAGEVSTLAKEFERQCGRTPQSKLTGCVEMDVDVIAADNTILRPGEFTRAYFTEGFSRLDPAGAQRPEYISS